MTDRQHIEQRAADWLALRDGAAWTSDDARAFQDWLDESTANRVAFLRLQTVWHGLDEVETSPETLHDRFVRIPIQALRWAAAAAAICILALTAFHMFKPAARAPQIAYATRMGEVRSVALADGSEIDLNTNSRLRTEIGRDERAVWLDQGEAFFSIKRDPARPFRIFVEGQEVRVIGTRFTLRREPGELRVMVIEGRVQLRSDNERDGSVVLGRGEAAIVTPKSKLITARSDENMRDALDWRRSTLTFRRSRLQDVAAEFNRYNDRKLVIADPELNGMRIGGQFRTTQVEEFARLLETGYALNVIYRDGEIRLSK